MLSFRELQEKKSKIKINPKKEDVIEGAKTMKPEKGEDCHCDHTKNEKKKRKEDTDHTEGTPEVSTESINQEETAYVSQEEVSEESDQSIDQEETSLLTFGQFTKEGLSIDDQMKISRDYNIMSPEENKSSNKKAMGNVKKVAPKKDTRTDAQKMTDATGPRPGSRYRGD